MPYLLTSFLSNFCLLYSLSRIRSLSLLSIFHCFLASLLWYSFFLNDIFSFRSIFSVFLYCTYQPSQRKIRMLSIHPILSHKGIEFVVDMDSTFLKSGRG